MIDRAGIRFASIHCAQPLINRFSVSATCRVLFALNTRESDALAEAVSR